MEEEKRVRNTQVPQTADAVDSGPPDIIRPGGSMMTRPLTHLIATLFCCLTLTACGGPREKKIEFVFVALGASDATGVGGVPLTEGYVYLIGRELDRRMPGVFVVNLGVPGARIDLIKEQ